MNRRLKHVPQARAICGTSGSAWLPVVLQLVIAAREGSLLHEQQKVAIGFAAPQLPTMTVGTLALPTYDSAAALANMWL